MSLPCFVAGLILLAHAIPGYLVRAQSDSGVDMHWVRGTVVSASSGSLILQQQRRTRAFILDARTRVFLKSRDLAPATATSLPTAGSIVEVHYTGTSRTSHAVLILDRTGDPSDSRSGGSGRSFIGLVRVRGRTMSIVGGGRAASATVDSATRLLDAEGRSIAKGRKAIARLLGNGASVLVKWDDVIQSDESPEDNRGVYRYPRFALEISVFPPEVPAGPQPKERVRETKSANDLDHKNFR